MNFIYTDRISDHFNYKMSIFPHPKIITIIEARDVLESDSIFLATVGKSPIHPMIGCAPMSSEKTNEWAMEKLNNFQAKSVETKLTEKAFIYEIFGIEHPWLKPQPDYAI